MRKVSGTLSICGHAIADEQWHSVCCTGTNLVAVECNSRRHIKYSAEIFSDIADDQVKKALKKKLKKRHDVGCVIFFKANWLLSRLNCEDLFDLSTAIVSIRETVSKILSWVLPEIILLIPIFCCGGGLVD